MLTEVGISVREVLKMDVLKDAKVLAGESGLDRKITGISVMEVPDISDWVKPGEFLVTTAYSIKDDKRAISNLIPMLAQKGLSGIAIKLKRYLNSIPDEMVEAANRLHFPIIELPYEATFSDVTSAVLREIFNQQENTLIKVDEIHHSLMNVVLSGGGLKEIGQNLSEITGCSLLIKDYLFGKSVMTMIPSENPLLEESIRAQLHGKYSFDDRHGKSMDSYDCVKEGPARQEWLRCVFPIIAGQKHFGEIHIYQKLEHHEGKTTQENKLGAVKVRAVQYSCAIIALELMKQVAVYEVENRHKNEFLEELLSQDVNTHNMAIKQAEVFGLEENYFYVVMVLCIEEMDKFYGENPIDKEAQYKNRLMQTIEAAAKAGNFKLLAGSKGNTITLLIALKNKKDVKNAKSIGMDAVIRIYDALSASYKGISAFAGVGRSYSNMNELWKSNDEAKKALSYSKVFKSNRLVHYDDLGLFRLLCMEHQEQEIRKFCQESIMPLIEYDRNKDGELVKTLQAYFECGGNLKKVCERMYIHYNTILYRIQKIQQITKLDLDNADDRLNLEISLKILNFTQDILSI